jgi:TetR/AcrR family transcriptional repressor of mexJK operon
MEEIATTAGLSKRTLYNVYADKGALFKQMVSDVIAYAEQFAAALSDELVDLAEDELPDALHDLGRRLALSILRPEVVALRRLLIGEARTFPELVEGYFERAPGRVMSALAVRFKALGRAGLLQISSPSRAAEQFAYLVVGAPLDRAILVGTIPTEKKITACARDGVETFLARYGPAVT